MRPREERREGRGRREPCLVTSSTSSLTPMACRARREGRAVSGPREGSRGLEELHRSVVGRSSCLGCVWREAPALVKVFLK